MIISQELIRNLRMKSELKDVVICFNCTEEVMPFFKLLKQVYPRDYSANYTTILTEFANRNQFSIRNFNSKNKNIQETGVQYTYVNVNVVEFQGIKKIKVKVNL